MTSPSYLPQIPKVPDPILEAAKDCTLVIFVGAGVSRLMGCPSWSQCAEAALRQLADDGAITYGDIQQLSHLDPKKRLSIALQISESAEKPLEFEPLILPRSTSDSKIYRHQRWTPIAGQLGGDC